jgi:4-carboxymuconolactone decarboxylase
MALNVSDLGKKMFLEVMGDKAIANTEKIATDFSREAFEVVIDYGFGRIWGDDAISKKQHSLNNLCILACLNRATEFEIHFKAAIRNGCTKAELRATLMQIMGYAGFPVGMEAFRIAGKVFEEYAAKGRTVPEK